MGSHVGSTRFDAPVFVSTVDYLGYATAHAREFAHALAVGPGIEATPNPAGALRFVDCQRLTVVFDNVRSLYHYGGSLV